MEVAGGRVVVKCACKAMVIVEIMTDATVVSECGCGRQYSLVVKERAVFLKRGQ